MKRSRDGNYVHRDDCKRAIAAVHWVWADGMSDEQLFAAMTAFPWLKLCSACFTDEAASQP